MNLNAYPELAENMRRVLAEHGWALRVAARKLGIGYSVLHNITSGVRAREGTLVRIAECIGEDPVQWLRWGGYAEVADSYARQADPRSAASPPAWTPRTEAPDRFTDDEEALDYLIGFYSGEPPQDPTERERLKRIIKATLGVE